MATGDVRSESPVKPVVTVRLRPAPVRLSEFEDLLATDNLFVDYFNAFLELPCFSEHLVFNKQTGAFEVVSRSKEEMMTQLRQAVHFYRPKPALQQLTETHSFRPIPLLPMELDPLQPPAVITQYQVEVLDRDEVVPWVKHNRLPPFLQSHLYLEYRLGKLLQQSVVVFASRGRADVCFDERAPAEPCPPVPVLPPTEKEMLMKELHLDLGGLPDHAVDEFLLAAKALVDERDEALRSIAADIRPVKEQSSEGFLVAETLKPLLPRPSEVVCRSLDVTSGGGVAVDSEVTKLAQEERVATVQREAEADEAAAAKKAESGENEEALSVTSEQSGVSGVGEVSGVIVGLVLKECLEEVTGVKRPNKTVQTLLHHDPYLNNLTVDDIDSVRRISCAIDNYHSRLLALKADRRFDPDTVEVEGDVTDDMSVSELILGSASPPLPVTKFSSRAALASFRQFLEDKRGAAHWHLWLEVERGQLHLTAVTERNQLVAQLREQYRRPGAPLELPASLRSELKLHQSANWTFNQLLAAQSSIAKQLLTYWAPRFLLSEQSPKTGLQQEEYQTQRDLFRRNSERARSFPAPAVVTAPPARPSACWPKQSPMEKQAKPHRLATTFTTAELPPRTPDLPNRRTHLVPLEPTTASSSRPQTRAELDGEEVESHHSDESVFVGGRRMEELLQALASEHLSGHFLEQFIRASDNRQWLNCLLFWMELQSYHALFHTPAVEREKMSQKAVYLYSQFVMRGAPDDIQTPGEIEAQVAAHLQPAYEELFDVVEEWCIVELYAAFEQLQLANSASVGKISQATATRTLTTKNSELNALQARGRVVQICSLGGEIVPDLEEKVVKVDRRLWESLPEEFQGWTLENVLSNRLELEEFRNWLESNYAGLDLSAWMEMESWRRLPPDCLSAIKARSVQIKDSYLTKSYFFGVNSPASKDEQNEIMAAAGGWGRLLQETPPSSVIIAAQRCVRRRLDDRWLPLFFSTPEFAERQAPPAQLDTATEHLLLAKRRRAAQVAKMLEGRWSSTTQEVLLFRQALCNPLTNLHFRQFVALRGPLLENDLLFWTEVQKFKTLHHAHADIKLLQSKAEQILNCFIDSAIPPSLQLDITVETAERVLSKRHELSPYLFREAQLTIFRVLISHWADFCRFRSNVSREQVEPVLARQKRLVEARRRQLAEAEKVADETFALDEVQDPFDPFTGGQTKMAWRYSADLERESVLAAAKEDTFITKQSPEQVCPSSPAQTTLEGVDQVLHVKLSTFEEQIVQETLGQYLTAQGGPDDNSDAPKSSDRDKANTPEKKSSRPTSGVKRT